MYRDRSFGSLTPRMAHFPGIRHLSNRTVTAQYAADTSLANTSLMQQLDQHRDYTVAQFAQAIGAIYFGCLGLTQA